MITTDHLPGSPCWIDVASPDPEVTAEFYRRLFGWEAESAGPEAGGYVNFRLNGALVGAISPTRDEEQPIVWSIYRYTTDLDETLRKATALGATVHVEPMDVLELGRTAYLTDPQGGDLLLWQPRSFSGLELTDAPGALMWTEMWTPSAQGTKDFYGGLFGWEFTDVELEGSQRYSMIRPAGTGEDRYFGGAMEMTPDQLPQTDGKGDWHPVFHVMDCDAVIAELRDAGGQVLMGPEDAPGVGRLAVCSDPFGAGFVLLTPSPT
ncbi:VOC family protein [Nocardiopsis alba]|uniref:VOC family protein n=1 Tax=Nocardiopsis alba TaxID=53437 RepID=UPI0036701DA3